MPSSGTPRFRRPPVTEVALGIQFAPLPLSGLRVAEFWWPLRNRFPHTEEQPPLPTWIEPFEPMPQPSFALDVSAGAPPLRTWLASADGTRLIQIQNDRFVYNWRRQENDADSYPSYRRIRREFDRLVVRFRAFVAAEFQRELRAEWAEVSYFNLITAGRAWTTHAELDHVLMGIHGDVGAFLPAPENISARWQYLIPGDARPIGRLAATAQPVFSQLTMDPILTLTMTARGVADLGSGDNDLAFLDVGHDWVVRGFADLTTPEMHKEWERTR